MTVDQTHEEYGWFEGVGDGKFKNISEYGRLFSQKLPLKGRWTVVFIDHVDPLVEGNGFGIEFTD